MTARLRGDRRAILEDVAAGLLAPHEAARLLESAPREGGVPARLVQVRASYRALDVIADPGVAEVLVVRGAHGVRRDGDVLVVAGPDESGGFAYSGAAAGSRLALRVNPHIDLDVEVTGGSVHIWGVRGAVRAITRASAATFEELTGPLDLEVSAGSARISGAPVAGDWAVRAHSASVRVSMPAHANVSVVTVNRHSSVSVLDGRDPAVLGDGRHLLRLDLAYSDAVVHTP